MLLAMLPMLLLAMLLTLLLVMCVHSWRKITLRPLGMIDCCVTSSSGRAGRLLGCGDPRADGAWQRLLENEDDEAFAIFHAVTRRLVRDSVGHTVPLFGLWLVRELVQDLLRDLSIKDMWRGPYEDEIEEYGGPGGWELIVEETWTSWLRRMASNLRMIFGRSCTVLVLALVFGRHQNDLAHLRHAAEQYYLDTPVQNRERCVPPP